MPLIIDDATLDEAGLDQNEARVEFACRLFEAGKLSKTAAGRLAGMDRVAFESELQKRGIDVFRYHASDLDQDLRTLNRLLGPT